MAYGVRVLVWGDRACFTRPEMKVERVSYDAMTPSAARGILEAIHWKPALRWVVDTIQLLRPIRFESVRRNEVSGKLSAASVAKAMKAGETQDLISMDFRRMENGAVLLKDDARKTVLVSYQERKREELFHVFTGEKMAIGLFPHVQAQLLARHLRGDLDGYPPFLWK